MNWHEEEAKLLEVMQRPYVDKRGILTIKGFTKLHNLYFVRPHKDGIFCRSKSISSPNLDFSLKQLSKDLITLLYDDKVKGDSPNLIISDDFIKDNHITQ